MASRWMAPKLAKMRRPYTDNELMILDNAGTCPKPEVLDAIADAKLTGGWKLDQWGQCETCWQCFTANGTCGCEVYVPDAPRTLAQRREARRLAVAVDMYRKPPAKRTARRKPKRSASRDRKLAAMGLR